MKDDYLDLLCNKIGFSSYQEYLDSDFWADLKRSILDRDNGICQRCGKLAVVVHHIDYTISILQGRNEDRHNLISLCGKCHYRMHYTKKGKKKPFDEQKFLLGRLPKISKTEKKKAQKPKKVNVPKEKGLAKALEAYKKSGL